MSVHFDPLPLVEWQRCPECREQVLCLPVEPRLRGCADHVSGDDEDEETSMTNKTETAVPSHTGGGGIRRGDRFRALGCECVVTRVGKSWVDLRVMQYSGAMWTKRQPLPLPADWRQVGSGAEGWTIHPGVTWREIIKESGRSQADVAEAMGTSTKHLSQIVNGAALPGLETTVAFAEEMGVSAEMMWRLVSEHRLALLLGHRDLTDEYL